MNWLRRFMMGRYGGDQLSITLLLFSVLIIFIAGLFKFLILDILAYVLLGIALFRILSKNISKRSMENYKFSMLMSPVYSWFTRIKKQMNDKNHKYLKCPKCKAKLRIPKGKGKIMITCPKCKNQFKRKT